jgi:hypothetical protein
VSAQTHKNAHIAQRVRKITRRLSTNDYTNASRISVASGFAQPFRAVFGYMVLGVEPCGKKQVHETQLKYG